MLMEHHSEVNTIEGWMYHSTSWLTFISIFIPTKIQCTHVQGNEGKIMTTSITYHLFIVMSISQSNEETERTHYCMYIHTTKSETVQAVFLFLNTPDVYNKTLMQVHYESEQKCLDSFLGVLRINTHGSSKWWSQRKTKKTFSSHARWTSVPCQQDQRLSIYHNNKDVL